MNIFKKFKVTFNLRNPNKKTNEKGESEVKCLKYRVYSEFSTEHVFDTNPRHIKDEPFTPTQSRKLHTRSVSENNIALKTLTPNQETPKKLNKNNLWPSESEIIQKHEDDLKQIQHETQNIIETKQNDKPAEAKQRKEKGILKNKNQSVETEKQYLEQKELNEENNYGKTSFNEEVTYEHFDPIDDQLGEEDIYYFDQKEVDTKDDYVVHKTTTVKFAESDHEYEEPIRKNESKDKREDENPVYNLSTHPKLNPTIQGNRDDEYARSIGLNTFGNTQKLNYPGDYSLEAKSIFFDDENDYDC